MSWTPQNHMPLAGRLRLLQCMFAVLGPTSFWSCCSVLALASQHRKRGWGDLI